MKVSGHLLTDDEVKQVSAALGILCRVLPLIDAPPVSHAAPPAPVAPARPPRAKATPKAAKVAQPKNVGGRPNGSPVQDAVLELLKAGPSSVAELAPQVAARGLKSKDPSQAVSGALTLLKAKGMVEKAGGHTWKLAGKPAAAATPPRVDRLSMMKKLDPGPRASTRPHESDPLADAHKLAMEDQG